MVFTCIGIFFSVVVLHVKSNYIWPRKPMDLFSRFHVLIGYVWVRCVNIVSSCSPSWCCAVSSKNKCPSKPLRPRLRLHLLYDCLSLMGWVQLFVVFDVSLHDDLPLCGSRTHQPVAISHNHHTTVPEIFVSPWQLRPVCKTSG